MYLVTQLRDVWRTSKQDTQTPISGRKRFPFDIHYSRWAQNFPESAAYESASYARYANQLVTKDELQAVSDQLNEWFQTKRQRKTAKKTNKN